MYNSHPLFLRSVLTKSLAITSLFAYLIAFSSCQPKPKEEAKGPAIDPKVLVSCEGIGEIKLTDSHESLVKKFGANAVSEHSNTTSGAYTTVWDGSAKQVNIFWKETAAPFVHVRYIESTSFEGPYESVSGLKSGMPVRDIPKINTDMPITFHNPFGTESPGLITTFNKGAIATTDPCITGSVEFSRSRNVDEKTLASFKQEKIVDSSHPLLAERMDMILSGFRVTAPGN